MVFPCEDKSIVLLYKLEPLTLTSAKVKQVKNELFIKKEAKGKGKLVSKKAKVKEEQGSPQIKVYLLLYKCIILLNLYK